MFLVLTAGVCQGCNKKSEGPVARFPGEAKQMEKGEPAGKDGQGQPAQDKVPRKIVYTAMINLIVDDFARADQALIELVKAHKGYVISSEVTGSTGSPRTGQWKVRVPIDQFDSFRTALAKLGEPERSSTDSQDVTEEYYDVEARIKTKKAEEASLLKLLENSTGKIEDILSVRRELSRVREEIERHQGRLQVLAKLTAMSTLTINVRERSSYRPPEAADFGTTIGRTFSDSWSALLGFGKGVVIFLTALVPWLPLAALIGVAFFLLTRRHQKVEAAVLAVSVEPAPGAVEPKKSDSP
jgi:hypothetical protein